MKTVARFSTRHVDGKPGQTDIFIGVMMKNFSKALNPDTIYEIREVLGELMIVPLGPVANPKVWDHDVSNILDCYIEDAICTKEEVQRTCEKGIGEIL